MSVVVAPKKCLTLLLETLETEQKIGTQIRSNVAAVVVVVVVVATVVVVVVVACPVVATVVVDLQNVPFATPKHHCPERRTSPRSAPKKCLTLRLKL